MTTVHHGVPAGAQRDAARRRALGMLAVAVAVAVVCTLLGRWQWHRHEARAAAIAVVETNYAAAPTDLADVLHDPDVPLTAADEWRTVEVTGRYLTDASVLLRNRPVDRTPAYHVLVPLLVTDASPSADGDAATGRVLLVDRGWVPTGADGSENVEAPAPPAGEVTVTVRLRAAERPATRQAPQGQAHSVAPAQVLEASGVDEPTYAAYGSLVRESPAAQVRPGALPAPSTDPGSHLSYAFQWWVFALGGFLALTVAAWREWRSVTVAPDGRTAVVAPPRPRRARGRDERDEDAEIDSQLTSSR